MKILLVEEAHDKYASMVLVINALERLQKAVKVYSEIFLVTDRKNTWEIAGSVKFNGVIQKKALNPDLFEDGDGKV